jgi:methyl-accepting chemotaxis protein
MSDAIAEIRENSQRTMKIVGDATAAAQSANTSVASLADSASKIGEVINLIQDIAEQTNLLALNATIEAARAGELGKGFAVVAAEVKNLANQTAQATGDIAAQIGAIQGSTEQAVSVIQTIAKTMEEANRHSVAIASAMEQQSSATAEISHVIHDTAAGTDSIKSTMSAMMDAAAETSSSAEVVHRASNEVADQAQRLRQTIDEFLNKVAA